MAFGNRDLAVDLGTANTLVFERGRGIVVSEPSVIAVDADRGEVYAVGDEAHRMIGRTPATISATRPLRHGVIADFEVTEQMLRYFMRKAQASRWSRPRVVMCVPSGVTEVETRAVEEACLSAGARQVALIEEPIAAAIGAGLQIAEPTGHMVVDIGGGTADVAVIKNGRVVQGRSVRVAGNAFDEAIMRYVRRRHQLVIGESNAERIKIEAGTAVVQANGRNVEIHIKGRDLREGRLKSVVLGQKDMSEALSGSVAELAEFILRAIEDLPTAMAREVANRGVVLTGGGSLLDKLDVALAERVGVPFVLPQTPMHCVIKGTALVLESLNEREHLLIIP
jgi:rod shape-determining protein MreB and related proteins